MAPQHHITEHPANTLPAGYRGKKREKKHTFLLFVCTVRAGCKLMNTRSEQPWGGFPGNKGSKARGAHLLPDGIWDTPTPSDFPRATHRWGKASSLGDYKVHLDKRTNQEGTYFLIIILMQRRRLVKSMQNRQVGAVHQLV